MARILIVEDDPQGLESLKKILELENHEVVTATQGQEALERLRAVGAASQFDLILSDIRMPEMGGLDFLKALRVIGNQTPMVLMTAYGKVEDAVWAMKQGAVDFLTKPFKRGALLASVEAGLKRKKATPPEFGIYGALEQIQGNAASMQRLRALIAQVAPTVATVLISGESGTGKERVARALHALSPRGKKPMVALNCAALPEALIESELFGYEKGAFTGAQTAKEGLFEAANGGTLFLDEIGEMPIQVQSKLLRVLQEGEVRRVGSNEPRKVQVRVIAATHRDLRQAVLDGKFRADLLYRLEVIALSVPPLRDRLIDLPMLVDVLISEHATRHGKKISGLSIEAMDCLLAHPWPGNLRELSNVLERAVIFALSDEIALSDLPDHVKVMSMNRTARSSASGLGESQHSSIQVKIGTPLKDVEDLLIRKTLEATEGDKGMTAKLLGINSRTIYRKLERDLDRNEQDDPV